MHQGDLRYFLSGEERDTVRDFDGFSFIRDSSYSTFSFQAQICIGENLEDNGSANYLLIFGYRDSANYNYIQMRNSVSRIYSYLDGKRISAGRLEDNGLPDQDYHSILMTNDGLNFSLHLDGRLLFSKQDTNLVKRGAIGFGSNKDAVYFDDILVSRAVTSVSGPERQPRVFSLKHNYPNPFNPSTVIGYNLQSGGNIEITIKDLLGRHIRTLAAGYQCAGLHEVTWTGTDDSGHRVASGVYLYTLRAAGYTETKKLLLIQ